MAIRGSALIPSTVTKTLICIHDVSGGECVGVIRNPYLPDFMPFQTSLELISIMEDFFDSISFPQAYYCIRAFDEEDDPEHKGSASNMKITRYRSDEFFQKERGEIATMVLQVQFRQNASWQGQLEWLEKKKQQAFRSTLEFLRLLSGVLSENTDNESFKKW